MKYTDALQLRKQAAEADKRDEQKEYTDAQLKAFAESAAGKKALEKVAPGEWLATGVGAGVGGLGGWLLSRLIHKRPKAWLQAIYAAAGAAAAGSGTWYGLGAIKGDNGLTWRDNLRLSTFRPEGNDMTISEIINKNYGLEKAKKSKEEIALRAAGAGAVGAGATEIGQKVLRAVRQKAIENDLDAATIHIQNNNPAMSYAEARNIAANNLNATSVGKYKLGKTPTGIPTVTPTGYVSQLKRFGVDAAGFAVPAAVSLGLDYLHNKNLERQQVSLAPFEG